MQKEKIIWEPYRPPKFPCFICEKNWAEYHVTLDFRGHNINTCLCPACAKLSETEILNRILGRT